MKPSNPKPNAPQRYGTPAFLLLLAGCGDPLKLAQRIEEPRILGARVSGAEDEATLNPGDAATLSLLLAGPRGPVEGRFAYQVCEAEESIRGVPHCAGNPFAAGSRSLSETDVLFDVPSSLDENRRIVVLGVACLEGEPSLASEPLGWVCSGNEEPLRVSFDARTRSENFTNRNPDLSVLRVWVAGAAVPLDEVSAAPSCAEGVPEVAVNRTHTMTLRTGAPARESLGEAATAVETLQVSHFSTRGTFARQFSFVDPAARNTKAMVDWEAPKTPGPVKQYFVVRDERGGVSWASVSLCAR